MRRPAWEAFACFAAARWLAGCGAGSGADSEPAAAQPAVEESGLDGKADFADGPGDEVLRCSQDLASRRPEASVEGEWHVYDRGPAPTLPDGLSWGLDEWVIAKGFPVKQYAVHGTLAVNGGPFERIENDYFGNLYRDGGFAFSLHPAAYGIAVQQEGKAELWVQIGSGLVAHLPLQCRGSLPVKDDAMGPNGLALAFACATVPAADHPSEEFRFGLVRIDRQEAIGFADSADDDRLVEAREGSDASILDQNAQVRRSGTRIEISGDADGVAWAKLIIRAPESIGDKVSGKFSYSCPDAQNCTGYTVSVRCDTSAL